jgi:hypothetical protein
MLPFGIIQRIASILLIGNLNKPVRIALQDKPCIKSSGNINGIIIGYHLVKLYLIAVAILYQPV